MALGDPQQARDPGAPHPALSRPIPWATSHLQPERVCAPCLVLSPHLSHGPRPPLVGLGGEALIGQQVFKVVLGHARLLTWGRTGSAEAPGLHFDLFGMLCVQLGGPLELRAAESGGKPLAELHGHKCDRA